MTAVALAFALPRLHGWRVSRARGPHALTNAATNAAIYRGELADLARQHAEGRLTDAQYAAAREEIERRLLADSAGDAASPMQAASPHGVAIAMAVALPAFAFGLYALFGSPARDRERTGAERLGRRRSRRSPGFAATSSSGISNAIRETAAPG